jgi:molybdenum cofactor cytidylyltransferase
MITAVILAAGESKRMGQPKMLLPWGNGTVLTHVVSVFQKAGLEDILVVTGGAREQVESLVSGFNVRTVHNQDYSNGEMLSSIQCGIRTLTNQTQGMLIGLGDQPQVQEGSVRMVCDAFRESKSNLVLPSYQMRRGHPWLVARPLWDGILEMRPPQSPRTFLNVYSSEIEYVEIDNSSILEDLDTPEDYLKFKP